MSNNASFSSSVAALAALASSQFGDTSVPAVSQMAQLEDEELLLQQMTEAGFGSLSNRGGSEKHRVFVRCEDRRGVISSTTSIADFFSMFGRILDVYVPASQRNVCYVTFDNFAAAEAAVSLGSCTIDGERIQVLRAASRPDYRIQTDRLFVKNIMPDVTPTDLKRIFDRFGDVVDVYIPRDKVTNLHKNFAFIRYATPKGVRQAMACATQVTEALGPQINLAPAQPRTSELFRDYIATRMPGQYLGNYGAPKITYGHSNSSNVNNTGGDVGGSLTITGNSSDNGIFNFSHGAIKSLRNSPTTTATTNSSVSSLAATAAALPPMTGIIMPQPITHTTPTATTSPLGGVPAATVPQTRIFIGGFPPGSLSIDAVMNHFSQFGNVVDVHFPRTTRSVCYVEMATELEAETALQCSANLIIAGVPVGVCKRSDPPPSALYAAARQQRQSQQLQNQFHDLSTMTTFMSF